VGKGGWELSTRRSARTKRADLDGGGLPNVSKRGGIPWEFDKDLVTTRRREKPKLEFRRVPGRGG